MVRSVVLRKALSCGVAAVSHSPNCNGNVSGLKKTRMAATALLCLTLVLLPGCATSNGGNGSGNNGPLAVNSNTGPQSVQVGNAFKPMVAVVTRGGAPAKGVSVTFTAPASGASGTFASGNTSETDTSDSSGLATTSTFTANGTAGAYSVTATASGSSTSATFGLTNLATPTFAINAQAGSMQSALVGSAYGAPLSAVVTENGSLLSGAQVTFTAPSSGPSGTFANGKISETDTTDANGVATSTTFKSGATPGTFSVNATTPGTTTPAGFSLTNYGLSDLTMSPQSSLQESTTVSTAFATPLSVVVTHSGAPVSNVKVIFSAPSTGASGTFVNTQTSETDTTNASGVVTSSTFKANATTGTYSVSASIIGGPPPTVFTLTNNSAPIIAISPTNGSAQFAAVEKPFGQALSAVVTSNGSPVSGARVTFTAPSAGASGTFGNTQTSETDTTDSSGIATSSTFTANANVGLYTVNATTAGASSPASFSVGNYDGSSLSLAVQSGSSQSTLVDTAFGAPLSVGVTFSGFPVSSVAVTFTAPSTGASGTFTSGQADTVNTDSNGIATSSTLTANATAGSFVVPATVVGGLTPANFNLTNIPTGVAGVFATGGVTQNAAVGTAFQSALVATVVNGTGNPVSGVPVTFQAPASGASGKFTNSGTNTEIVSTDPNGHATSSKFTANGTAGGPYNVTATASGVATPANFLLTNTSAVLTSYAFYVSGQSLPHPTGTTNYYAIAGAITVDQPTGAVIGGEEDYNDANGYTYAAVPITGGTFSVSNTTGQGTFSLNVPSQPTLGNSGTETFGVQFVNSNHALIMQYDGSATSFGTLDLQNLSTPPSGGYAFTIAGTDPAYAPLAMGGVLAFNGNLISPSWPGTYDLNDGTAGVSTGNAFTANVSTVDQYGRGQVTGIAYFTQTFTLNYYQVGPQVLRIIDMDPNISAVGSAFGQGTNATSASNAGLGASVFAIASSSSTGNPSSISNDGYSALGQFTTDGAGAIPSGVADEKELSTNFIIAADLGSTGTYQVGSNGYGTLTIPSGVLGNVSSLALYLTDPNLNLNDPNNTSGGGGGLLVDLDATLPGGTGFVVPQTDTSVSSFIGNYAVGWQNLNNFSGSGLEFDVVAQGAITATNPSSLSLTGLVSDPFATFSPPNGAIETSGLSFQSNPDADGSHPGRYTMLGSNNPTNLLSVTIPNPLVFRDFNVVVYQASGSQLFWLDVDNNGATFDAVFLGPVQQLGSLSGIPLTRKSSGKLRKGGTSASTTHSFQQAK